MPADRARPERSPRRSFGLVASVLLALLLGLGAWRGSDGFFAARARQQVANRWAALRRCLLGDAPGSSELPGERLRRLGRTAAAGRAEAGSSAERCAREVRGFDSALASRSLASGLERAPRASEIVDVAVDLGERADKLDRLWIALRDADLPPADDDRAVGPDPTREPSEPPPAPAAPKLASFGSFGDLGSGDALASLGAGHGTRLLLPKPKGPPLLCSIDDASPGGAGPDLGCRPVSARMPGEIVDWRLAQFELGAPELVYGRTASGKDGFFDATTGQRIWRPGSADAQAVVSASGAVSVLYPVAKKGAERGHGRAGAQASAEVVDHFQLARLRPGRPPANNWLDVPATAQVVLTERLLVWWVEQDGSTGLYGQGLGDEASPFGPRHRAGTVPDRSRLVSGRDCNGTMALVLADAGHPARHTLVQAKGGELIGPVDLGPFGGDIALGCRAASPTLAGIDGELGVVSWQCEGRSCARSVVKPPGGAALAGGDGLLVVAPLGSRLALASWRPAEGLRLRVGEPAELEAAREMLLLEPEVRGRPGPKALRLLGGESSALLLAQSGAGDLHLLSIDVHGAVTALRPDATLLAKGR